MESMELMNWMNELATNVLEDMSLVHWMHVTDELVVSKDIRDVCKWFIGHMSLVHLMFVNDVLDLCHWYIWCM